MSEATPSKPGTAFWVISGLFAVWNLSGMYQYYLASITTADQLEDAGYNLQQVAHIMNTPVWAHSAYAIAVTAGVLGVLFLLLRKRWAVPMFALSLVGALVQDLDAFVLRNALEHFNPWWLIVPILVIVICIVEIWYARRAQAKGWLG